MNPVDIIVSDSACLYEIKMMDINSLYISFWEKNFKNSDIKQKAVTLLIVLYSICTGVHVHAHTGSSVV